jgi:hypothetical protein
MLTPYTRSLPTRDRVVNGRMSLAYDQHKRHDSQARCGRPLMSLYPQSFNCAILYAQKSSKRPRKILYTILVNHHGTGTNGACLCCNEGLESYFRVEQWFFVSVHAYLMTTRRFLQADMPRQSGGKEQYCSRKNLLRFSRWARKSSVISEYFLSAPKSASASDQVCCPDVLLRSNLRIKWQTRECPHISPREVQRLMACANMLNSTNNI